MLYMDGADKFTKAAERFKSVMKRAAGENIDNMDADELEVYQAVNQAIDAVDDVIVEQQAAFKEISEQLDKLNKALLEKGLV